MFIYDIRDVVAIGMLGIGFLAAAGLYLYGCYEEWKKKRRNKSDRF